MGIPTNNTATSSVTLTPSADLQITKDGPLNAVAGTNVVYTITVTNAGPSDATGVTLADPTPPGLTFVSNAGDCTTAFPCDLGTLPRAATRTITATFAIPAGYTTPNPIANTATVSSPTPDAAAGNNSATTNTPVGAPVTDLHITKTNGVNGVVAGPADDLHDHRHQPARAERRDWRHGHRHVPGDADRRDVDLRRHRRRRLRRRAGSGDINTPVTVPVGATVVFTATGTVDPAATGELVNSAQVLPPLGHANRTSATATDRDAIGTEADVAITKTVDQASIVAGNPLVYTITVTNTGPSDAAGVVVSDATPTGLVFVSNTGDCTTAFPCALGVVPAGATRTITATFTVPPDYSGPSPIENVTDVSSTTVDTNTTNNTATAVTTLNRDADVEVTKTVPSSGVLVGDEIVVTINCAQPWSESGDRHRNYRKPAGRVRLRVRVGEPGRVRSGNGRVVGWIAGRQRNRATGPDGDGDGARRDHESRRQDRPERAGPDRGQRLCGGSHHRDACRRSRGRQGGRSPRRAGGRDADIHSSCNESRTESGDGHHDRGCVARRALVRVGGPFAGLVRHGDWHLDGRGTRFACAGDADAGGEGRPARRTREQRFHGVAGPDRSEPAQQQRCRVGQCRACGRPSSDQGRERRGTWRRGARDLHDCGHQPRSQRRHERRRSATCCPQVLRSYRREHHRAATTRERASGHWAPCR